MAQRGASAGRCRWEHCRLKDPFAQVEVEESQCGVCRDSVRGCWGALRNRRVIGGV